MTRFFGCLLDMKLPDFFQLNDWNIKSLLIVVFTALVAFWGSIGSDVLGFSPLLRQITGFLLLTFVPGILILRILRAHHLGATRTTVYAVGLSLATLMFTGFFMNMAYPLFGIYRPISLWPLIATISVLIGVLCFFAWFRDWDFATPISINLCEVLSPPVLALSLLPFGAIAGTYLMNFYGTNLLQMLLLPVIALVPVVIVCTQFIPEKYYPYAVFSIAITLLYHTALISTYIWGWDIQYEYYLTNIVIQNSLWDFTNYSTCNAMLSLMMLAPIYSIFLDMEVGWVFKVIYPFFFALVPLGLYAIFRKQVNEKISFLACFFFMSIFVFYTEMVSLARQEVAELFLVLILLSMIDQNLSRQQKSFLLLIFTASLIVSHYGLSYIFMLLLLIALGVITAEYYVGILDRAIGLLDLVRKRIGYFTGLSLQKVSFKPSTIPLHLVIWYGLFLLIWYIYIASSSSFEAIVYLARPFLKDIFSDLLNPDAAQGIAIILNEAVTPLHEVAKYLHLLTIFLIIIGFVITVVVRQEGINFDTRYLLLSCGALGICIGGVALPYFASALNTSRLYQISLILLAPFCVVGGVVIFSGFRSLFGGPTRSLQILSVFFGLFLLFNCGWIYEFTHDVPTSFALNNTMDSPVFNEGEVYGATWLVRRAAGNPIYCDMYKLLLFRSLSGNTVHVPFPVDNGSLSGSSYLFFGTSNIHNDEIALKYKIGVNQVYERRSMSMYTSGCQKIYNSRNSLIYYSLD